MSEEQAQGVEVDQLPEGAEMLDEEDQQLIDQKEKEILSRVLDRAASDPEFKQRLLDDPSAALRDAGVAEEAEALERGSVSGLAEVAGQRHRTYPSKYGYRCVRYTTRRRLIHWSN